MVHQKLEVLKRGIPLTPMPVLRPLDTRVPHAPKRVPQLSNEEFRLGVRNILRYFPEDTHSLLGPEFAAELRDYGHIYCYRFLPTEYDMKAYPIDFYPGMCDQAKAIMLMIMNNLNPAVAQFPHELITYGGNGSVLSNWAQYHILMQYLTELREDETLVMYSGHPMGVFPSSIDNPRVIITNGMMIPNYSTRKMYDKLYATGVSMYGQMTAGSYCYIGPQGIVHGTTITVLNAGRKYLGLDGLENTGVVFVTSGLGGMSGAQAKAGLICGAVTVVAEVDRAALDKRHRQGWVQEVTSDVNDLLNMIADYKQRKGSVSIAFHGNIVTLLEALAADPRHLAELISDQTSLHNPFNGGYYPVEVSFEESKRLMASNPDRFKDLCQASLRRHAKAINKLVAKGSRFWDYGNCFLLECSRAGGEVLDKNNPNKFRYPSYVQHIMGDVFSLGFGPFRWVCTSGDPKDLRITDRIAAEVQKELRKVSPKRVQDQLDDNIFWIEHAEENKLVVGSQARILYSNCEGRTAIAKRMNLAVASGEIKGPIVISRDHHDVSGTDSPFRETANITDGSMFCADMAIQNVIGDAMRGATWVAIHNGGGVGWGEVMNGGFGLVLDGSIGAEKRAEAMLLWDVNNGIARRAWDGNENALFEIGRAVERYPKLKITKRHIVSKKLLSNL